MKPCEEREKNILHTRRIRIYTQYRDNVTSSKYRLVLVLVRCKVGDLDRRCRVESVASLKRAEKALGFPLERRRSTVAEGEHIPRVALASAGIEHTRCQAALGTRVSITTSNNDENRNFHLAIELE